MIHIAPPSMYDVRGKGLEWREVEDWMISAYTNLEYLSDLWAFSFNICCVELFLWSCLLKWVVTWHLR